MTTFPLFLAIDCSGARTRTSRLPGLQVYAARAGEKGCERWSSRSGATSGRPRNWTRAELAQRLLVEARSGRRFLAGIDHCFSFPRSYFERYRLASWPDFLDDFVRHWPTQGDDVSVDQVRKKRPRRTGKTDEFRLTERWTSSAKSVFQFDVQGSVAKSSHAGIPWLKWLRDQAGDRLHFWPFDGWTPPAHKSVIAEVYPSIFRKRYAKVGRTGDEQDAYATARWMAEMAERGALEDYFAPPLTDAERRLAECEGWILGVR